MSRKIKRNIIKAAQGNNRISTAWHNMQIEKMGNSVKYWLMRWANLSPKQKRSFRQLQVDPTSNFLK